MSSSSADPLATYRPAMRRMITPDVRIPPHNNEAEQAVLGAMMLEKEAVAQAMEILKPESFYRESHRFIFEAMLTLADRNMPIDITTLPQELRASGRLDEVGGAHYLSELNLRTPTAANVGTHARLVFEKALKRTQISAYGELQAECYDEGSDAFDVLDRGSAKLFEISANRPRKNFRRMKDIIMPMIEEMERMSTARESGASTVIGIPTGLTALDIQTGGMHPTDLTIIAARPSMGKSGLAATIARNAAAGGKPVAFFPMEMSDRQVVMRLLATETGIESKKLRNGLLSNDDWAQIVSHIHRLTELPIVWDDTPALTPMQIAARVRELKRTDKIELVIIDYLQLMKPNGKYQRSDQGINEISKALKALAKEVEIPVIALSQLNRGVESRPDKRPMLSDIRESGAIEEDADNVMFIYRPEYYGITIDEEGMPTDGMAEIIIAKQRSGPTGTVRVKFDEMSAHFSDLPLGEAAVQYQERTRTF